MGNLLSFLQFVVALVALYVTLYLSLKKKYQNLQALRNLRKTDLPIKQFIKKCDKIEECFGLLNTIYIIITLIAITVYFSPFKGFFQFFREKDFNTPEGRSVYILSSSLSFLLLTYFIVKYTFFEDIIFLDGTYQYIFYSFVYFFSVVVMLKINQLSLIHFTETHDNSIMMLFLAIGFIHLIMDTILLVVYMFSLLGYGIFMDFLNDKFTD